MQARFPFFRQKTALAVHEGTWRQKLAEERSRAARSLRCVSQIRRRPRCDAQQRHSGAICGTGRVNGRIGAFRASEGVFRRIHGHGRSRRQKECVRRRLSDGRGLFVRFRTDWRIRRSRSSWSRRHGRVPPTYPCRRWSSSRACRWRSDGRGDRPSGRCCNRRSRR